MTEGRDSIASVTIEGSHLTPEAPAMMDAWAHGRITEAAMMRWLDERYGAPKPKRAAKAPGPHPIRRLRLRSASRPAGNFISAHEAPRAPRRLGDALLCYVR